MSFTYRNQPFKTVYLLGSAFYILGALSVWTMVYLLPAMRPRRSWTLKRALIVTLIRNAASVVYNTGLPAPTLPEVCEKDAHALGFIWVEAAPELIIGEVHDLAEQNGVKAVRVAGFWVGPRSPSGKADYHALPDERVIYHFHGE